MEVGRGEGEEEESEIAGLHKLADEWGSVVDLLGIGPPGQSDQGAVSWPEKQQECLEQPQGKVPGTAAQGGVSTAL